MTQKEQSHGIVSIIIPHYNNGRYIKSCVESVVNQNLLSLEIIIVDDNSTDNSWEILKELENKYGDILKIQVNPKKGACSARNYGLQKSNGEYIQFLDSDDLLSENKVINQLESLRHSDEYAVANCGWIHFSRLQNISNYVPQQIDRTYATPIDWLVDCWSGGGMGQTGCWLIPKVVIDKAGGWDESLLKSQDGEFMARVITHSSQILFSQDVFSFYRKPSKNNVSSNKSSEALESVLKSYKLYEQILKFENSERVRKALCHNYSRFVYSEYGTSRALSLQAIKYIEDLGETCVVRFPSKSAQLLSQVIGYKVTLKLRKLLKGY